MRTDLRAVSLIAALLLACGVSPAQEQEEPLFDRLLEACKTEYLSFGVLFQGVGDFGLGGNAGGAVNGFTISTLRFYAHGELDGGFGYLFRTDVARSRGILDARMQYTVTPGFRIAVGQFKAPFSAEFLTGAGSIDFVNRAQAVTALSPGRQIGVQIGGQFPGGQISYAAGMFNGNGTGPNINDGNGFLYAGRIAFAGALSKERGSSERIEVGLNAAYSQDHSASFGGGYVTAFAGKRTVLGGDVRLMLDRVLLSGEVLTARLTPDGGPVATPSGFHLTAGHMVAQNVQVLIRYDVLSSSSLYPDSRLVIAGLNVWPSGATEVQVNYVIPVRHGGADAHRILINAQVAF